MDAATQVVFIQMPLLLVVGVAAASLAWWYHEGAISRLLAGRLASGLRIAFVVGTIALWAVITIVSWWVLFLGAYLSLFAAYIVFGVIGGWVALVAGVLVLASVPVVWGVILFGLARRELRYVSSSERVRAAQRVRAVPS